MALRALLDNLSWRSLALAAVLALPAIRVDALYVEPSERLSVPAFRYTPAADGAFWTYGDSGLHHTLANGETTTVFQGGASTLLATPRYFQARALADGGLLQFNYDCAMRHVEPSLISRGDLPLPTCYGTDANAHGAIWSWQDGNVRRIRLDGSVQLQLSVSEPGAQESVARLEVQPDGGFYVLISASDSRARRIARYDADGSQRWSWHAGNSGLHGFAVTTDGVFAYGRDEGREVEVARLDASGKLRWRQRYDIGTDGGFGVFGAHAADNGALYIGSGQQGFGMPIMQRLTRVAADGSLDWQATFCPHSNNVPLGALVVDADGNVVQICPSASNNEQLIRRDARGNVVAAIDLPVVASGDLQRHGDSVLLSGRREDAPLTMAIMALDRSNQLRYTAVTGITDYADMQLLAQTQDAAGNTYLLSQVNDYVHTPAQLFLSKIGPDNQRRWRHQIASRQVYAASLSATAQQVCSYQRAEDDGPGTAVLRAYCLDAGDGSVRWQRETLALPYATPVFVHAAADGSVRLLHSRPSEPRVHELLRLGNDGRVIRTTRGNGDAMLAAFDASGRTTVMADRTLLQYAEDGTVNYSTSAGDISPYGGELVATGDGGAVMTGNRASSALGRAVRRVGADGRERWSQPLEAAYDGSQLLLAGDAVYVLQHSQLMEGAAPLDSSRVRKLSLADGGERWRFDSINPYVDFSNYRRGGAMALTARGDLLLAYSGGNHLRLQRLDGASGARLDERKVECSSGGCSHPAAFSVDASGTARAALALHDPRYGLTSGVVAVENADADPVLTRIDQPAITRAWGSSYANGEGLLLDWLPDSRTLFGAWFTYDRDGGADPAHLRWYTLQATAVAAGTTTLELPILQTSGGNFAAGPAVAPQVVGTARLRFVDCDGVLLDYTFNAAHNGGARGTLTLSPLSRENVSCLRADGSVRAPVDPRVPQGGFDARMSGTWFDPAVPGQGLQFIVRPGSTFFAPWFTFDPVGSSNDATRQHWFTLQGDLAGAIDGAREVLLVQTLGGRFDSRPTDNSHVVGRATVHMLACDRARLDYRFDDDARAGAFAGRGGTLSLHKAGGCAAP